MTGGPQPTLSYRPEIDGLRAIAVGAVILFHAGASAFSGGFLGVDVFFVISGYLITGIIRGGLERGEFSFLRFYERRARRILPALLVMMILTLPVAVLVMMPSDLKGYGGSMVATTLSANNVLLYLNSGYFAVATEFKPLMHSWSLGVEEQYYLLVPVLMAGAWRLDGKRTVWLVIAIASLASFIACIILSHYNQRANFYLIWSRIWELGAGAATMLAEPWLRRQRIARYRGLTLCALMLIVTPMIATDRDTSLPGWTTLVPVLGTCILLGFGTPGDPGVRLLSARPVVFMGLLSYSAYLYHQPLFAFARIVSLDEPGWPVFAGLILATFALAWLSWRLIEQPFRSRAKMTSRCALALIAIGAMVTIGAGLTIHRSQGFARYSQVLIQDSGYDAEGNTRYLLQTTRNHGAELPAQGPHRLLVIGDSFARDFINAGRDSGNLDGVATSYDIASPCLTGVDPRRRKLLANVARADHIVIAYRFDAAMVPCIDRFVHSLRTATQVPITILGNKNFGKNPRASSLTPPQQRAALRARPLESKLAANRMARQRMHDLGYVDIFWLITGPDGRLPLFTPEGRLISEDSDHLTPAGAKWLGPILFAQPELRDIPVAKSANPLRP